MTHDDKVNILIVDDLPEKLLVIETILESLGQNLVKAMSGREALRCLLDQEFAVILLDVNMPDMDGFETAAMIRARKQTAHTPIIFVTAFADEMHTAQGYSLGAVDYILSPVVAEILRTKVGVFVDLYRKNEQIRRQAEERIALARAQAARAAAEEATRRSTFLAEASTVLVRSLDDEQTLGDLAGLSVPFLGDLSAATLVDDQGEPTTTELAWVHPADGRRIRKSLVGPIPHAFLATHADLVRTRGRPIVLTEMIATEREQGANCPALADATPGGALPAWFQPHSGVLVPLRARGRVLGTLTLTSGCSGRRYGPDELALAEDLAGRAAIAIDNARLYRDIQDRDRRRNEFLAMLAHELRNPLAPIRNAVQVLRLMESKDDDLEWASELIARQLEQMVRMIDDLLDVSRITGGKIQLQKQRIDVATVVARAVESCRPLIAERHHDLVVSVPPDPIFLEADTTRLAQVLANLLNNAAKYTHDGGRITISVERAGTEVVIRVADTGVGIPAEMISKIFDLFTQVDQSLDRAQGGLGIGLTLVRHLVQMHGGSVHARSAGADQGSEFVLRLPALAAVESASAEVSRSRNGAPPGRGEARRLLIVDDNEDSARSLAKLMRLGGHDVVVCHDGPAALETLKSFPAEVVVLDIGLPGLNGYDVARTIRQQAGFDDLVLIALTGYGRAEDRQRSQEVGFDHHFVKPVDLDILASLVASSPRPVAARAGHEP